MEKENLGLSLNIRDWVKRYALILVELEGVALLRKGEGRLAA
jgi:hypothetical protein